MIINLDSITIDKAIPGLNWTPSRCSTLADLLAALVAQAGSAQDIHAVSGVYDPATEAIIITLSNHSTFSIPAALLLPVTTDGDTITGNGTAENPLIGYKVEYDPATGALTITPPGGAPVTIPAQTALTEPATDTEGLLGAAGSTVTTQQLLDALATRAHSSLHSLQSASPSVINPITAINGWTNGSTQQTPITTISVTNPTDRTLLVQLAVFHGLYVRNSVLESPKVQTLSAESIIEFDDGTGTLTLLSTNPPFIGNSQLAAIAPASDTGQSNNAGIQVHTTNLLYRTLAPGATVTYRARATATVRDGGAGNIWTYTSIGVFAIA